jgi:GntR family transcriptional repressor for pyruvate dehydrogenase complex
MELRTVARRSVCDDVYDQLAGNIMRGGMVAGESLHSERRLAEILGVSRPIVREAIRRLTEAGLVEVRQGGSTTVRDFRRHAGLSLLAELLMPAGHLDLPTARSLLEARQLIGPQVAALAAQRSGAAMKEPLDDVLARLEAEADPVARQWHSLAFWDLLVDGADSIVFRLMYNGLRTAYEPLLAALSTVLQHDRDWMDAARALVAAVAAGDAETAHDTARRLLTPSTNALLDAIDRMEAHP